MAQLIKKNSLRKINMAEVKRAQVAKINLNDQSMVDLVLREETAKSLNTRQQV
jgi:hypothetical protein